MRIKFTVFHGIASKPEKIRMDVDGLVRLANTHPIDDRHFILESFHHGTSCEHFIGTALHFKVLGSVLPCVTLTDSTVHVDQLFVLKISIHGERDILNTV